MKHFCFLIFLLCSLSGSAQNPYVTTGPFLSGLTSPVAIAHCNDSRLFIVQKNGIIRIADALTAVLNPTPFLNIDPRVGSTGSEQGLLGMAFDPDYKNNGYFYLNYTNNTGNTTISRFSVDPADSNLALPNSELILHLINQPFSNHNGGNLKFGPDGYLYIGMGDGGSGGDPQGNGQNFNVLLAKMLRIDVSHGDTSFAPPTNPYINTPATKPQIWQTGMRNPWRYSFDRLTGDLWIGDVGQNAIEEIDFQPANSTGGENWGWRCYEGNAPYNTAGCNAQSSYDAPIYTFSHSGGNCSVTGGYVYRGPRFQNLNGYYLFTDYCASSLRTLKVADTSYLLHATVTGLVVSFGEDMFGELYALNMGGGEVLRITDTTGCAPNAILSNKDTIQLCDTVGTIQTPYYPIYIYSWYKDNVQLPDTTASITVNSSGSYVVVVFNPLTLCFNSDTVYVKLGNPATTINWTSPIDTLICKNVVQFPLSAQPAGGTFYGWGVTDSVFNPQAITPYGHTLLQYDYTDSLGCKYSSTLKIWVDLCTGIKENDLEDFKVYPNPASNEVHVQFGQPVSASSELLLQDAAGRIIQRQMLVQGTKEFSISLNDVETGSYVVSVHNESGITSRSLMIVK